MSTVPPNNPTTSVPNDPYKPAQYEFGKEENVVFEKLATQLGRIGTLIVIGMLTVIAYGLLQIVRGRLEVNANLVLAGLFALLLFVHGIWFRRAGTSFQKIVDFRGKDQTNLMEGLKSLSDTLSILATVALVVLVLGFFAAVYGLFTVVSVPGSPN